MPEKYHNNKLPQPCQGCNGSLQIGQQDAKDWSPYCPAGEKYVCSHCKNNHFLTVCCKIDTVNAFIAHVKYKSDNDNIDSYNY